jgi:hypothetical protein
VSCDFRYWVPAQPVDETQYVNVFSQVDIAAESATSELCELTNLDIWPEIELDYRLAEGR